MSWQRILRFAKQRQVPVIITDESGEDPMILLSLDALEQALDGAGTGPDLPPVQPTPKSTTPSFVPDVYENEVPFVAALPVQPPEAVPEAASIIEDIAPTLNTPDETLAVSPAVLPVESDEAIDAELVSSEMPVVAEEPIVINDFESPNPAPEPQRPEFRSSDVEIMTPPQLRPEPVSLSVTKKEDEVKPVASVTEVEPLAPKGISLEERFFLDF
jgi:hypothetical protein